jgi:hypothetical protein
MLPDRTGLFRFRGLELAVAESKNGFPQAAMRMMLTDWFNPEAREFATCEGSDFEWTEYAVLFYKDKKGDTTPTFNYKSIMEITGWDGRSFASLAAIDATAVVGQIKLVENDYPDSTVPYKSAYLAKYDADPNSQLKKLDAQAVADLDKKFAGALKQSGKAKPAATLPATTHPARALPTMPPAPAKPTPADNKPVANETVAEPDGPTTGAQESPAARKPGRPASKGKTMPAVPPVPAPRASATPTKPMTQETAWEHVQTMRSKEATDDQIVAAWNAAIEKATEFKEIEMLDSKEWTGIADAVLAEYGIF